ncbi:alpha/beta hydrolase [Thauera sp. Sel9]|uniref:alpha/beta hydrolase n=1 Tax=Thauera sp. Sel9 TaxID=2974299 RepID=UPI0021E1A113|nr:alpha/beta hydrolase [Thauera sp. Sel9]MCV2217945.1 alpha/beta hydrolase [Thauera sp. Sel9]
MTESVTFKSYSQTLAGVLHLPADFDPKHQYAAIVCVHPSGGVKEQTAGLYAGKLAEQGFVALAFDAGYQGESSGEPRHLENPHLRVEDVSAAIDHLTTLPYVDNARIGVLGVCAGGGYAVNAAVIDTRIKALGAVSAVNYGQMYREGWDKSANAQDCLALRDMAMAARTAEANGEPTRYLPTVPDDRDAAAGLHADFAEAYDYYRSARAQHCNAPSKMTTRSLAQLVTYDAFSNVELFLTQPLQIVAGSEAGTRWMSEELFRRAASKDKDLLIVEGGTHIAMYDQPDMVGAAMARFAPFFKTHL